MLELRMWLTSWNNMFDSLFVSGFWAIQLHSRWRGQMVLLVRWLWALPKQLLHYKKLGELCHGVLYESSGIMWRLEFLVVQCEIFILQRVNKSLLLEDVNVIWIHILYSALGNKIKRANWPQCTDSSGGYSIIFMMLKLCQRIQWTYRT